MKKIYHIRETIIVHCTEMPRGLKSWFCKTLDVPWQSNDRYLFRILKFHKDSSGRYLIEHGGATYGNTTIMAPGILEARDDGFILVKQLFEDHEIF